MTQVTRGSWAGAYYNNVFIGVATYSGYRDGTSFDPKGTRHLLALDSADETVGQALLDALAHSRFVLPSRRAGSIYPPDLEFDSELGDYKITAERFQAWAAEMMERYGYGNKRTLFKDMKSCSVARRGEVITIRPSHHEKLEAWSGEGISEEDYVVVPADSSPAQVGAALRLAFSRCTG